MGNAMRPEARLLAAPRCGAHCRTTGQPCKGPAINGRARCRMHGGRAGRKPTHGRYTKESVEQRRQERQVLKVMRALLGMAKER